MRRFLLLLMTGFLFFSCDKNRQDNIDYKDVFIYYGAGYNNLNYVLSSDINDLKRSTLPSKQSDKAVVVYFQSCNNSDWDTPTPSHLVWLYRHEGRVICDTLTTYPSSQNSATCESLTKVLTDVDTKFQSDSYGLLFSSHATGYLPPLYLYSDEYKTRSKLASVGEEIEYNYPLTKSIGAYFDGAASTGKEIDFEEFAEAIPYKLDYLMFDACLMGGIEAAWALKDVCNYMIASPCEVLGEGFDYVNLVSNLFQGNTANLEAICSDYYNQYAPPSNATNPLAYEYSASISLYDMSKINAVKESYSEIIKNNRGSFKSIQTIGNQTRNSIQGYFYTEKYTKRYFYDLRDISVAIGASDIEIAKLDAALKDFVVYHKETPAFFGTKLERCCGVSSYIPREDYIKLNDYYKNTSWNKAANILE